MIGALGDSLTVSLADSTGRGGGGVGEGLVWIPAGTALFQVATSVPDLLSLSIPAPTLGPGMPCPSPCPTFALNSPCLSQSWNR